MQRVRIGFTGLAFVFVIVMLAAIFTRASDEELITANNIDPGLSESPPVVVLAEPPAAPVAKEQPKEPLAELGVAPGNAEKNAPADKSGGQAQPQ